MIWQIDCLLCNYAKCQSFWLWRACTHTKLQYNFIILIPNYRTRGYVHSTPTYTVIRCKNSVTVIASDNYVKGLFTAWNWWPFWRENSGSSPNIIDTASRATALKTSQWRCDVHCDKSFDSVESVNNFTRVCHSRLYNSVTLHSTAT